MKHYICRPMTEVEGYLLANFKVKNEDIVAGQFFRAERLTTSIDGNFSVYSPDIMAKADDDIAIILNNSFETLEDGRRPNGNSDYTTYVYKKNEVITGVRLVEGLTFELGMESIIANQEVQAGGYLIPEVGENKLIYTETLEGIDSKEYLLIEGLKDFRVGGQFGSQFVKTMIVRVKRTNIETSTLDITVTPAQGLEIPLNANTVVATLETTGGTAPYTYTLTKGLQDNDLFEIDNTNIKSKGQVTEARTYHVIVTVTDNTGIKKSEIVNILIDNPSITAVNVTMTGDIIEGEKPDIDNVRVYPISGLKAPVAVDTKVADIVTTGGSEPYTYTLPAGISNNDSFKISGSEVLVKKEITEGGSYAVMVKATDKYNKTKNSVTTAFTIAAE